MGTSGLNSQSNCPKRVKASHVDGVHGDCVFVYVLSSKVPVSTSKGVF